MKMNKSGSVVLILFFLLLLSCKKEADFITPTAYPDTPEGNFDAFWNGVDQNYVFFEYDPVDWDKVYSQYKPLVNNGTSQNQLFNIFYNMMLLLIDGHKKLYAPNLNASAGTFNSEYKAKHPDINTEDVVINNYLSAADTINSKEDGNNFATELIYGIVAGKKIIYVRSRYFGDGLSRSQSSSKFDQLLKDAIKAGYYGLILDLRHNGGGLATGFYELASRFVNNNYQWGYSQIRLQRDRFTMSPLIPETIKPADSAYFGNQVVILTDRYSFSAAEITTMVLHNLPNVTVIGDTTGGANGPIIDVESAFSSEKDFTGNFTMPNGWKMQLAQKVTLDKNKQIFEGKGVPPDLVVVAQTSDAANNVDRAMEAAIDFLGR